MLISKCPYLEACSCNTLGGSRFSQSDTAFDLSINSSFVFSLPSPPTLTSFFFFAKGYANFI